jgi:hypothetical protein
MLASAQAAASKPTYSSLNDSLSFLPGNVKVIPLNDQIIFN